MFFLFFLQKNFFLFSFLDLKYFYILLSLNYNSFYAPPFFCIIFHYYPYFLFYSFNIFDQNPRSFFIFLFSIFLFLIKILFFILFFPSHLHLLILIFYFPIAKNKVLIEIFPQNILIYTKKLQEHKIYS